MDGRWLEVNTLKFSLRSKLTLSFVAVTMVCVGLISIFSNFFLEKHFAEYVKENQEQKNIEIISQIKQQYKKDVQWNTDEVKKIGINALEQGLIIKVLDKSDNTIWDAVEYNNSICKEMISKMSVNMHSRYPNWEGGYTETDYALMLGDEQIGRVKIGYYGPFYYDNKDLAFINTLNRVFISVGIISLFVAVVFGFVISNRLSRPISRVIATSQMIAKGFFGDRVLEKSNTKDIDQLTSTINELATTLENQEKLRKRLTGDVAHELRTPLATLQSHMEAMIDGVWKPDTERLKSCHDEVLRIGRMVGDLERLARYESENLIINKEEFNIVELINHIVYNFESEFKNKRIDLLFSDSEIEQFIFADKDKISQVIVNLVSNALKYTNSGGIVVISLNNLKDKLEIIIKDNGIGIAEKDIPFIFERFYRTDTSRNRNTGGSGIGLTISKSIIAAHKGEIAVRSKENEGTEFIVSIPK